MSGEARWELFYSTIECGDARLAGILRGYQAEVTCRDCDIHILIDLEARARDRKRIFKSKGLIETAARRAFAVDSIVMIEEWA